ncbi:cleavage and polyadenylation specificity factor subunit 3-I-like [Nicotiana sylvestris]|uniref:cleavage and polyadenylation specificity factor subunit 3-I-like n=1 Tax=Nicotiana sylvestris TaxID=4096 RepID=UPI00388C6865
MQGVRVLIPAFALGRAQELLLVLEEYWSSHPELANFPIYYASPLARRCMAVYQTYINAMNERIRNQFVNSNPFNFKHISSLNSIEDFIDNKSCVVMASPGSLQSGLSRQLFDKWCSDKKNDCVILSRGQCYHEAAPTWEEEALKLAKDKKRRRVSPSDTPKPKKNKARKSKNDM